MVVFVLIIIQIVNIQTVHKEHYKEIASKRVIKKHTVEARRGNIYAEDGSLLATTVIQYDVSIDPTVSKTKLFNENIDALSDSIYKVFGAPHKDYYGDLISKARSQGKRYVRLRRKLSFDDYKRLRSFPILNKGRFKGGVIVEERMVREHPLGKVAERTIGYEKDSYAVGLEGAYSGYLAGINGERLSMKLQNGSWKALNDEAAIEPEDGADIFSTIDIHIQDVSHYALLRQLEKFEADHGTVVVMEVNTGKIKGIVNLGRTENGKYYEKVNYAVYEAAEPGSTFKLPALIAALEDGVVDTSDVVDTEKGKYKIYNRTVRDSHEGGYGKISVKKVFEESSNVGMAKIVHDNYKDNPSKFLDRLYSMRLDKKVGVNIKGEGTPILPSPGDSNWSGTSLAWMSYGYGVHLTPLQILTFYNAIANDGVEVKPYFVSRIRNDEGRISDVKTTVLNSRICSENTLHMAQDMLEGVVEVGTGKSLRMENLKIAGKTGTTQMNYWEGRANMKYSSSFVGYFPVENPKYSMIVVVNNPNSRLGYYGAQVAAPVFKEIAVKIFHDGPEVAPIEEALNDSELLALVEDNNEIEYTKGIMPNLKGFTAMNAVAILENLGLRVTLSGNGKVIRQSILPGRKIRGNNKVNLLLR